MQAARLLPQRLLRCERRDDFLKARLAAQRTIPGRQFQCAIANGGTRWTGNQSELFAGEIFFPNPSRHYREIHDQQLAIDRVFFRGKQLDRAPAFAPGHLLPPESGIDYTEHVQREETIWVSENAFLSSRQFTQIVASTLSSPDEKAQPCRDAASAGAVC
jgi:hypothetical protein